MSTTTSLTANSAAAPQEALSPASARARTDCRMVQSTSPVRRVRIPMSIRMWAPTRSSSDQPEEPARSRSVSEDAAEPLTEGCPFTARSQPLA